MELAIKVPEEMRRRYLERRSKDLESLVAAAAKNDFLTFQRIGHQLKGNARSFGFDELADLGDEIEAVGKNKDLHDAQVKINSLKDWLEKHFIQ